LFNVVTPPQGLLGTYWDNENWEGEPLFKQVTPFLFLAWPDEQPVVPNGPFSARFTGALHIVEPGIYQLKVDADDGARLALDGVVLGESLSLGRPNNFEASTELASGDHPMEIDYIQHGGGSALKLYWRRGNDPWMPVPPAALIPGEP
jgi:hypothetical protein